MYKFISTFLFIFSFYLVAFTQGKNPEYLNGSADYANILKSNIKFPPANEKTMDCGYVLGKMWITENGLIEDIQLESELGDAFNFIAGETLSKLDGFTQLKNSAGIPVPFIAVQPIGFLFNDQQCPSYDLSISSDSISSDTVIFFEPYAIFRNGAALGDKIFKEKALKLVDLGQYKEAIPLFEKGFSFDLENSIYPYNLGICYYHERQVNIACEYLRVAKKMGNKIAKKVLQEKCSF